MKAGKLDRRIRIERKAATFDAMGGEVEAWSELATVWASKEETSDGERQRAAQTAAVAKVRFQIRYWSGVADVGPRDRIVFEGRTFNILNVKEIGRREGIEISCSVRDE